MSVLRPGLAVQYHFDSSHMVRTGNQSDIQCRFGGEILRLSAVCNLKQIIELRASAFTGVYNTYTTHIIFALTQQAGVAIFVIT